VTVLETVRNNTIYEALDRKRASKLRDRYNGGSVRFFILTLFPWMLCAQDRPQFVWQGDVDGINVLHLRDNVVDVKVQQGAPVANQRFQFYDRLPQTQQDLKLEVRQGRGYVHIIDQPRLENGYTAAVSIEDRQEGAGFYSIALYWDASNRFFEGAHSPGRSDQLVWTGRVDEEALISCHAKACVSNATQGAPVAAESSKFSKALPNKDVEVALESALGRGQIRLVEQPRQTNDYTARVSIRDPQSGSAEYTFTLSWGRPSGKQLPQIATPERGLVWSGIVEGRVRVALQSGSSFSEVVQGKPIKGEHVEFIRPIPSRSDLQPVVKKLAGRGRVEIVEYPSHKNHYRLVFEITNSGEGADNYDIEVDW
jgi:hypothetical protein